MAWGQIHNLLKVLRVLFKKKKYASYFRALGKFFGHGPFGVSNCSLQVRSTNGLR
jgi:hypothetical protein